MQPSLKAPRSSPERQSSPERLSSCALPRTRRARMPHPISPEVGVDPLRQRLTHNAHASETPGVVRTHGFAEHIHRTPSPPWPCALPPCRSTLPPPAPLRLDFAQKQMRQETILLKTKMVKNERRAWRRGGASWIVACPVQWRRRCHPRCVSTDLVHDHRPSFACGLVCGRRGTRPSIHGGCSLMVK